MVNYLGFTNFESECFYMYYFKVFKFSLFLNFNETQLTCPAHCSQYKPTKERNKFNSVRTCARVNPCSISNFYFLFHLCLYWCPFWQNFPERRGSRFTVLFHVNWVRVLKKFIMRNSISLIIEHMKIHVVDPLSIEKENVYIWCTYQSWNLFNIFYRISTAPFIKYMHYILHFFKHSRIKQHTHPEISFYLNYNILSFFFFSFFFLIVQTHILCAKTTTWRKYSSTV